MLLANTNEEIKSITLGGAVSGYDKGLWDINGVVRKSGKTSLAVAAALANGIPADDASHGVQYEISRAIEGQVDVYDEDGPRGHIDSEGFHSVD